MQAGSETEIFCPSQAGTGSVRELGRAWGPGRKQLQAVEQEQGPWGETGLSWAVADYTVHPGCASYSLGQPRPAT